MGLQHNINKAQEFCKQWGLSIKIDKTKIMIFSKNGRAYKDRFQFILGHANLECLIPINTLGIIIRVCL